MNQQSKTKLRTTITGPLNGMLY